MGSKPMVMHGYIWSTFSMAENTWAYTWGDVTPTNGDSGVMVPYKTNWWRGPLCRSDALTHSASGNEMLMDNILQSRWLPLLKRTLTPENSWLEHVISFQHGPFSGDICFFWWVKLLMCQELYLEDVYLRTPHPWDTQEEAPVNFKGPSLGPMANE